MNTELMFSSEDITWATPPEVFDPLDAEFGFTVDVCASADNRKVDRFFDEAADGLAQDWSGEVCWMNPPYGRDIRHWMAKAQRESMRGATVVCLVPARTDTAWWHDYVQWKAEVRFRRGRIKFVGAKSGAPFPSAIVIYRPTPMSTSC